MVRAISLCVIGWHCMAAAPETATPKDGAAGKPDIVIILADDIGYSDFGCYGGEIPTPNIDRIAASGVRFTQYYSENMCAPARTALLTGQYHLRKFSNPGTVTIAEALKPAGYRCYAVGKWHNFGEDSRNRQSPLQRGFDHFYGTPLGCGSFFAPLKLSRDGRPAEHEWQNEDFYYTDAITDNAVSYIRKTSAATPLFLYAAYTAAHWPLHARPQDIARHRGRYALGWDQLRERRLKRMKALGIVPPHTHLSARDPRVPAWKDVTNPAWQQRRMEVYTAQIEVMDQRIGRIVQALRDSGRLENTLIMVLVDNGGCHVEYGANRKGPFLNTTTRDGRPVRPGNLPTIQPGPEDTWQSYGFGWANLSNTPFRMFKQYEHEGGIKVPLIVQWPKTIRKGGQICRALTHVTDLLPTVLDAADVPYPQRVNKTRTVAPAGTSLLPLLRGQEREGRALLFWQFQNGAAVRQGDWKLVRTKESPWELYDLAADPVEMNDLASVYPEKVAGLSAQWQTWRDADYSRRNIRK